MLYHFWKINQERKKYGLINLFYPDNETGEKCSTGIKMCMKTLRLGLGPGLPQNHNHPTNTMWFAKII